MEAAVLSQCSRSISCTECLCYNGPVLLSHPWLYQLWFLKPWFLALLILYWMVDWLFVRNVFPSSGRLVHTDWRILKVDILQGPNSLIHGHRVFWKDGQGLKFHMKRSQWWTALLVETIRFLSISDFPSVWRRTYFAFNLNSLYIRSHRCPPC